MYFCGPSGFDIILSGSHRVQEIEKKTQTPSQKYQNPGEVSKVELTHPGVTKYLLPIAPQIGYLLDIYWIYLLDVDSISVRYLQNRI